VTPADRRLHAIVMPAAIGKPRSAKSSR